MIAEVTDGGADEREQAPRAPLLDRLDADVANQEDHVSMAAHGARRLAPMVANLERILGIEALCAAQGIEFRAPLATSPALQAVRGAAARCRSRRSSEDRFLAPDLAAASALVASGALAEPVADLLPAL